MCGAAAGGASVAAALASPCAADGWWRGAGNAGDEGDVGTTVSPTGTRPLLGSGGGIAASLPGLSRSARVRLRPARVLEGPVGWCAPLAVQGPRCCYWCVRAVADLHHTTWQL